MRVCIVNSGKKLSPVCCSKMPRRHTKYKIQISNYGRIRKSHEWRIWNNGTYCERFGSCRYVVTNKGKYYDVISLSRVTFGENYKGRKAVNQLLKDRSMLVSFRGNCYTIKHVSEVLGVKRYRIWKALVRGTKICKEPISFYYKSPEKDPSSYYVKDEKWAYPKYGIADYLSKTSD